MLIITQTKVVIIIIQIKLLLIITQINVLLIITQIKLLLIITQIKALLIIIQIILLLIIIQIKARFDILCNMLNLLILPLAFVMSSAQTYYYLELSIRRFNGKNILLMG